ncbi:MAG: hydrogenase nickel incorporation protein HypB [Bdellovibrionota bacterium]
MCGDCGCEQANTKYFEEELNKATKTLHLERNILEKNDRIAHQNYHWFEDQRMLALNIMSSPGSGKTSLLEKTLAALNTRYKISVLVGDQQSENDANRLRAFSSAVKQIITHSSCHLDADMIKRELDTYVSPNADVLFIENVGNLVCPAAFDLGESAKIALLSTTEGEDKPIKYPVLFNKASAVLLTKTDLIPYLDWNEEICIQAIRKVNPTAKIIKVSTKTGKGMADWIDYVELLISMKQKQLGCVKHREVHFE